MKKFRIIENINKLKEISVNSEWINNGQKNLQNFMAENPVRNFEPDRHNWQEGIFKKLILKPMPIAIIAIIASLITGSGVVTASQNSLPTDRLYPVKLIMEKVEEATTFDKIKKVELQTKLATNRLEEIKQLQLQGRATKIIVENNLQKYQSNLTKAQVYLANINTDKAISWPKVIEVSKNLEKDINSQGSFIATIEAGAPVEYKTVLSQKRESVLAGSPAIPILSAVSTVPSVVSTVINTSSITAETPTTLSIPAISIPLTVSSSSITSDQSRLDVISKDQALEIAKKSGLAKGTKEWTAGLYWYYGKINNYVWAISNNLSEFNGQTVIINAKSGEVYQISDYQVINNSTTPSVKPPITVTPIITLPPTQTSITPKPDNCPEYINCMPGIIKTSLDINGSGEVATSSCQIPIGCEKITKIAY
ncbi:MAG: DUF5667 domain-containing protein [Patescibacteria group bacterium]|jgi:hypothetical protein